MGRPAKGQENRRLTPRQMQILTFIRDARRRQGYSPTMQEIADQLGVSKVTVFEHVGALVRKKLLRRLPHKARSLEPTESARFPDERPTAIPLVGRIAAGRPIEAIEDVETLDFESMFQSRHETFVLEVHGDSMIDEQIRDGDQVIVERRTDVRDGETVVALLADGEATLKKLYRERGGIRLQPANKKYKPIHVNPGEVQVQGVVIGVVRQY
ncbi:MAG TPA: transcriptional repressor LexA [Phycisphaerae bacterium]|nr:transcriptional repressor LexA [Phycisphaerae bacterium]